MNYFDLYSFPIVLLYKNNPTYSTRIGKYISILAIMSIIFSTFFFGKDLYLKTEPIVITQDQVEPENARVQLTQNNFIFALYANSPNRDYKGKEMVVMDFHYQVEKGKRIPGKLDLCTNIYNSTKIQKLFEPSFNSNWEMEDFYCLADFNFTVGPDDGFFRVNVKTCKNTTESSKCPPQEVMDDSFENDFNVVVMFSEVRHLPFNYSNPVEYYLNSESYTANSLVYHEVELIFKKTTMETDEGIIVSSIKKNTNITLDKVIEKYNMKKDQPDDLLTLSIKLNDKNLIVRRTYIKIQMVFANLGGIIKFFHLAGHIVVKIFGYHSFQIELINHFFSKIEEKKNERIIEKTKISSGSDIQNLKSDRKRDAQSVFSAEVELKITTNKINLIKLKDYSIKKNKSNHILSYSSCDIFSTTVCSVNKLKRELQIKEKLKKISFAKIKENLEILKIFSNFRELQLIKSLLLTEDQLLLLEYAGKPSIKVENKEEQSYKISKLQTYYKLLKSNETIPSAIDQKLLSLLDKDLERVFIDQT